VVCVVPTFRCIRYAGGQAFKPHADPARYAGIHPITSELGIFKTFVTLALHLNKAEEFKGGALNCVELMHNLHQPGSSPPPAYRSNAIAASKRGMVAIFEHKLTHDADAVHGGVKHMMQCDVLYQRRTVPSDSSVSTAGRT